MIYVFIGLFMVLIFGLCFLVDKLIQRARKRRGMRTDGLSHVRLARRNIILGLLLSLGGLMVLLFLAPSMSWVYWPMGGIICAMGLFLLGNYIMTGIDYDDEGFSYRKPFHRPQRFTYDQIRGEVAFATRGGINATLYVGEEEVNVYSSMDGTTEFLQTAYSAWCAARNLDPEQNPPPNPSYLLWFPDPPETSES